MINPMIKQTKRQINKYNSVFIKLGKILCCALLVLSASGMAQVSADLHVPTRSEVGPQAMPKDIAPVKAPFQFQLAL